MRATAGARGWFGNGGNTAFLSLPAGAPLPAFAWPGVVLCGAGPLWVGPARRFEVMRAVKTAFDPQSRFPNLDD